MLSLWLYGCWLRSTGERPAAGNASVRCKRHGGSIDSGEFLASSYETCTPILFRPCHLSFSRVASPSACQASFFINNRQPEADSAPGNTPSFLLAGIPRLRNCHSRASRTIQVCSESGRWNLSTAFSRILYRHCLSLSFSSILIGCRFNLPRPFRFIILPSVYLANYLSIVD